MSRVVETNYYTKNRLNLIKGIKDARTEGSINILTFCNLFDVEKYLYYLQKQCLQSGDKKETVCVHHNHEWRPMFYLRAEYNWQKKLHEMGHSTAILCRGNTENDRKAAVFYRGLSCKVKTGINCAGTNELMVFGDLVIQVFVPQELKQEMDRLFSRNPDKLDSRELIEKIFEKNAEIQVVINKDRKIADQIRQETMRHFR